MSASLAPRGQFNSSLIAVTRSGEGAAEDPDDDDDDDDGDDDGDDAGAAMTAARATDATPRIGYATCAAVKRAAQSISHSAAGTISK